MTSRTTTVLITALAFRRHGIAQRQALEASGHRIIESPYFRPMSPSEFLGFLRENGVGPHVEGIIAGGDRMTEEVIEAMPNLRVIARWGVGVDAIDLDAATRQGVFVANTPGHLGDAVSDLAMALMLALARQIVAADRLVRSGGWQELSGVSVWRKSLGIVGFGSSGQALARRARGFEMTVRAYDPYVDESAARALGVTLAPLDVVLSESDFVSLHADLNPSTRGMINRKTLAKMKRGAYLINTARGGFVDDDALIEALDSGQLAGVALDAHSVEPPPSDCPYFGRDDVILTPHIGFSTAESIAAVNATVLRNLLDGLSGRPPRFLVNDALCRNEQAAGDDNG